MNQTSERSLFELGNLIPTVECLVIRDGKVSLLKRSEHSKNFPNFWIPPGGHVDEGEDYLSAVIREVKEETGIKIDAGEAKLKAVVIGNHLDRQEVYIVLYFLVHLRKNQKISHSEEGVCSWLPIDGVLKMDNVFPPSRYYLDHVISDKPGILYTNVELKNLEIVKVKGRKIDSSF